ncbi:uncharacterized protein SAZU_4755, partial [Streptomyces azureus]
MADVPVLVTDLGDHREHLDRRPLQPGGAPQRSPVHPRQPVRGRGTGRGERLAALLAHHLPPAAPRVRDHPAPGPGLHAQGLRHHLDHDQGRPGGRVHHLRHLVLPARLRQPAARLRPRSGRRQPARRRRPGVRPRLHPGPAKADAVM